MLDQISFICLIICKLHIKVGPTEYFDDLGTVVFI